MPRQEEKGRRAKSTAHEYNEGGSGCYKTAMRISRMVTARIVG